MIYENLTPEQLEIMAEINTTIPITAELIQKAHKVGFIAKKDLIDGAYYQGDCRNASVAKWIAEKDSFVYLRNKWHSQFLEYINDFEDDDGYDTFIPFCRLENHSYTF
jgi:hypothetical protein